MPKAVIYYADGRQKGLDRLPTLQEAQSIVKGYIELVHPVITPNKTLIVNEEGQMMNLELNWAGTRLYGNPIVGDIIVVEGTISDL